MSYGTELGTDTFGNITRINNALADMPQRLNSVKVQLENLYKQQENAKMELQQPFPLEQELIDKSARLVLLDAEPDMDHSKPAEQGQASEEAAAKQERVSAKQKPSILESLKAKPQSGKDVFTDKLDKTKEACL